VGLHPPSDLPIINAYWDAEYRFENAGIAMALRFDRPLWMGHCEPLPASFPATWGIVTACNPGSRMLSADENKARTQLLARRIAELGVRHSAALNTTPEGGRGGWEEWEEPGFAVWEIERAILLDLARIFEQRAVIWGSSGKVGILETATERWISRGFTISKVD
jgi:hypothetical protein